MYNAKELREQLKNLDQKSLIDVIAKLYRLTPENRLEIDHMLQGSAYEDESWNNLVLSFNQMRYQTGANCKRLLADFMKVNKDKDKRVDAYYLFVSKALEAFEKDQVDHKMLMVASASFGKALAILRESEERWDAREEETQKLCAQFHKWHYECCYQALTYYHEALRMLGKE